MRIGGIVTALIGVMCLPIGYGVSPRRDLSAFNNIVDTGAFVKAALALIAVGILAIVVSRLVPGDLE